MRIYLDVCCLNRPFDDQRQEKVRLQAEAVILIIRRCRPRHWTWVSSWAVEFEIARTPDPQRRALLMALLAEAHSCVPLSAHAHRQARGLVDVGFHRLDALHLAMAEAGNVEIFLTTDSRLQRVAKKVEGRLPFKVMDPVSWLLEVG